MRNYQKAVRDRSKHSRVQKTCARFQNGTYRAPDGSKLEPNKHNMFRRETRRPAFGGCDEFQNGPPITIMGMGAEGALGAWYADMTKAREVSVRFERANVARGKGDLIPTPRQRR